jgi:hypothetical protein
MNRHRVLTLREASVFAAIAIVCVLLPAGLFASMGSTLAHPAPTGWYHALDFHTPWAAARSFAAHRNPYVEPNALVPHGPKQSFVYPAPTAALLVPLGFLPYEVAVPIFIGLLTAAVAGALWLFGVRDWRCYGAAFASPAVFTAVSVGTLTPLLLLGVAVSWRWRNRPLVAGMATGLTVILKVFLWPVLLWLWFSGRRRAAVIAVVTDVMASVSAWAWISFGGFNSYPHLLQRLGTLEGPRSYAPFWAAGISGSGYLIIAVIAGVIVAIATIRSSENSALAVAIVVALLVSPVLWLHYLALLAAVAALKQRRLHVLWILPLLLWTTPQQASAGTLWRILVAVATIAAVCGVAVRQPQTRIGRTLLLAKPRL